MSKGRSETLVIVDRDGVLGIEMRELVREGEKAFLVFGRSDGTEVKVEVEASKLCAVRDGRIQVDFQYRGGAVRAPEQEVGR